MDNPKESWAYYKARYLSDSRIDLKWAEAIFAAGYRYGQDDAEESE